MHFRVTTNPHYWLEDAVPTHHKCCTGPPQKNIGFVRGKSRLETVRGVLPKERGEDVERYDYEACSSSRMDKAFSEMTLLGV